MRTSTNTVQRLVTQIVQLAHPLRVILFGSASRGESRQGSDVDLLVVVAEDTPRRRLAQELYCRLDGGGVPFDIVVATPSLLKKHRSNPGLIYGQALREGREVYAV
jgi:predicted nucleotidyltransferase